MRHQPGASNPPTRLNTDLVDIVAAVAVALGEALKDPPPLYRGLKRSLALLVAEIRNIEFPQQPNTSNVLETSLNRVANVLQQAVRSDYVQTKFEQLVEQDQQTSTGFRFPFFNPWGSPSLKNAQETTKKWKDFPYPVLGMLYDLVESPLRNTLRTVDLLSDDRQPIDRLKRALKDWNKLIDQVYAGEIDEYQEDVIDREHREPFVSRSAFCGETSVRHLVRSLYDILHVNWPCQCEDHDHSGKLGHCVGAKFHLDPNWCARDPDPSRDSFFCLLTGLNVIQECRVSLETCAATGDERTLVCLVDHEDSRTVCLELVKDENNRLWSEILGQPPETLQPDEDYVEESLGNLLDIVKPTYAAKRVLGVILARSIPHLLDSPWLPRSFTIHDLSIFCRLDNDRLYPFFDKVFLSTKFKTGNGGKSSQRSAYSIHPFPAILALGVVLTEIELGEDLAELYSQPTFYKLRNRPFELAKALLRECQMRFHESGLLQAVKFCIDRTSFLPFANVNVDRLFNGEEFINTFYMNAVRPLEQDLVSGAKWTWDEVKWLERANYDDDGICKIITKLATNNEMGSHISPPQVGQFGNAANMNSPGLQMVAEEGNGVPDDGGSLKSVTSSIQPRLPTVSSSSLLDKMTELSLEDHASLAGSPSILINRDEFQVAIICALPLEADAMISLFDHRWDEDRLLGGKDPNDPNSYTLGTIGGRNVILAHQPGMGKAISATVAACCAMTFKNVKLALVVGVCGGVPVKKNKEEILLGDVLISKGVIQYDLGRQFSDGFKRKIDVEHLLGRPNARISSLLAKLETRVHRNRLEEQITQCLTEADTQESYPGEDEDKLFPSSYPHKHQHRPDCRLCANSRVYTDSICDIARESACGDLGCEQIYVVQRRRRNQENKPLVHIGLFASGDSVVKSAAHRDTISRETGVIAFEMEGAGAWDAIPCVIIKGVCDYADSHKNKLWQEYAAITAAACAKSFVRQW